MKVGPCMCLAKCSTACPWSPATPFTSGEDRLGRRVEVSVVVAAVEVSVVVVVVALASEYIVEGDP